MMTRVKITSTAFFFTTTQLLNDYCLSRLPFLYGLALMIVFSFCPGSGFSAPPAISDCGDGLVTQYVGVGDGPLSIDILPHSKIINDSFTLLISLDAPAAGVTNVLKTSLELDFGFLLKQSSDATFSVTNSWLTDPAPAATSLILDKTGHRLLFKFEDLVCVPRNGNGLLAEITVTGVGSNLSRQAIIDGGGIAVMVENISLKAPMVEEDESSLQKPEAGGVSFWINSYQNDHLLVVDPGEVKAESMEVLNLKGEVMASHKVEDDGEVNISMENAAPGMYLLRIRSRNSAAWVRKFILL